MTKITARLIVWTQIFLLSAAPLQGAWAKAPLKRAQLSPQQLLQHFRANWQITPTYKTKGPGGIYEAKTLTRFVTAGQLSFYVGNITYYKFPKQEIHYGETVSNIAEKVRYAMGFEAWRHRTFGVAHVYETEWKSANRFVRMYITETRDSYAFSIALIRAPYAENVAIEAELLQRQMGGVLDGSPSWLDRLFAWVSPSEVHADCASGDLSCLISDSSGSYGSLIGSLGSASGSAGSLPGVGAGSGTTSSSGLSGSGAAPIGGLGDLSSLMGGGNPITVNTISTVGLDPATTTQVDTLNQNLANTNTNWGNSNTQIGVLNGNIATGNTNWANTNTQIGALNGNIATGNTNWANTNDQINTLNTNIAAGNTNWANSNTQINTLNNNIERSNAIVDKNWTETNNLMRKFMDPKHAFVWASASAAGAAMGVMAVNLVVDSVIAGGKAIYGVIHEAITHQKEEAKFLAAFKTARENWEKMNTTIKDLEKALDSSIKLRQLSTALGLNRETALKVSALLEELKVRKELKQDDLRKAIREGQPQNCIERESALLAQMGELLRGFELVKENMVESRGDAVLCDNLQSILTKLREAEGLVQKARTDILAAQDIWLKHFRKDTEQYFDKMEAARERQPKVKKEIKKFAEELKDLSVEELEEVHAEWEDKCVEKAKSSMSLWKWVKTPVRKNCRKEFETTYASYTAKQKAAVEQRLADRIKSADEMYKYSQEKVHGLRINGKTLDSEFQSYLSWFKMLQAEQACSLKDPMACPPENYSGMLDRVNRYDEREGKIQDICQNRLMY